MNLSFFSHILEVGTSHKDHLWINLSQEKHQSWLFKQFWKFPCNPTLPLILWIWMEIFWQQLINSLHLFSIFIRLSLWPWQNQNKSVKALNYKVFIKCKIWIWKSTFFMHILEEKQSCQMYYPLLFISVSSLCITHQTGMIAKIHNLLYYVYSYSRTRDRDN